MFRRDYLRVLPSNNRLERAALTDSGPTNRWRRRRSTGRYPVVGLCLASLSAHGESAPGQFMVGLR